MKKMVMIILGILLTSCNLSSQGSSTNKESVVMQKAKCLEMGQSNPEFAERRTEKDWIHYDFYYSSVLDTCVVEKMVDRVVNDDIGTWYVLFDMLAPEGLNRQIIDWNSLCDESTGTVPSYPDVECTTRVQYEAEKERVLPDY